MRNIKKYSSPTWIFPNTLLICLHLASVIPPFFFDPYTLKQNHYIPSVGRSLTYPCTSSQLLQERKNAVAKQGLKIVHFNYMYWQDL